MQVLEGADLDQDLVQEGTDLVQGQDVEVDLGLVIEDLGLDEDLDQGKGQGHEKGHGQAQGKRGLVQGK